jgi:hypothetical protein
MASHGAITDINGSLIPTLPLFKELSLRKSGGSTMWKDSCGSSTRRWRKLVFHCESLI